MRRFSESFCSLAVWTLAVLMIAGGITINDVVWASADQTVATVEMGPDRIVWWPNTSSSRLILTVSGPQDAHFNRIFEDGDAPCFELLDNEGNLFPDGLCNYSLGAIAAVGSDLQSDLQAGREPGDESGGGLSQRTLVQSGSFLIRDGIIETEASTEGGDVDDADSNKTRDQVINDDLIVDGSECVGFDCVNGESFGYDTLRLKENNLRIHFNDTSTAAAYPTNDWRITINDSSNGGASYFGIDDVDGGRSPFRIEAGAPSYSLYVDDGGRIGLGTSTPSVGLHIVDCDTPTVRLDQDGSCGWAAQRWDVAGNEANFFIRDVTNGSTLPFRIQPGAPSSTLTMKSDGKVGIGTWSPEYNMELETTGENAAFVADRTDGATCFVNATADYAQFGSVSDHPLRLLANSAWKMKLNTDGTLEMSDGGGYDGTWNDASSREYKENIRSLEASEAMETINGLNPVKFNYKSRKDERVGFIAEEVPDLVAMDSRKTMCSMDVVAMLTKVVQEQQKAITELSSQVADLERKSQFRVELPLTGDSDSGQIIQ